MTTRVLITDGDNRSALAATRSLGRRGDTVFVAAVSHRSLSSVSRYCSQAVVCPDPLQDPEGFVSAICLAAERHKIDVVVPFTEVTTLLLAANLHRLPSGCRFPFAGHDAVSKAADKSFVLKMAERLGVPAPRTRYLEHPGEVDTIAADGPFPIVVKPARSRVLVNGKWISTGVQYASDRADLIARLRRIRAEEFPILLQERINGPGAGVFACYNGDRPVAFFAHRRLREKPPSGGVSVLRESAPLNPAATEHATRLLNALGWRGVAMVEFKTDLRDGTLRLMEINGRFWGSLQLAIDAGVDFPALLVDLAMERQVQPVKNYRLGVRSRWWWGDVDSLLSVMFRSRASLNLLPEHPGRWRTLFDFLHLWGRDLHYEVLSVRDLRPWLLETRRWFLRA